MQPETNPAPQQPIALAQPVQPQAMASQAPVMQPIQQQGAPQYAGNPTQYQPTAQAPYQGMPAKKANPSIAAQILYAFGIIGLIVGGLVALLGLLNPSQFTVLLSVFTVALAVLNFVLVNKIRGGKKWALIAYSVFIALFFIYNIVRVLMMSDLAREKLGTSLYTTFTGYALTSILIVLLWTRHRNDFS